MNPFINLNKRGPELPEGCKELVDVLHQGKRPKCEYCGAASTALVVMGVEDWRYCKACQRDLKEFAKAEVHEFKTLFNTGDEVALAQFRAGIQRRQDDFMRERVKERGAQ